MPNYNTVKIIITGIVQGIGFRPFVYKLAQDLNVQGYVLNNSNGVEIVAQADTNTLNAFIKALKTKAPPLSVIELNHVQVI